MNFKPILCLNGNLLLEFLLNFINFGGLLKFELKIPMTDIKDS